MTRNDILQAFYDAIVDMNEWDYLEKTAIRDSQNFRKGIVDLAERLMKMCVCENKNQKETETNNV